MDGWRNYLSPTFFFFFFFLATKNFRCKLNEILNRILTAIAVHLYSTVITGCKTEVVCKAQVYPSVKPEALFLCILFGAESYLILKDKWLPLNLSSTGREPL